MAACTNAEPKGEARCGEPTGDDYLPTVVGDQWTYDVTDAVTDLPRGEKGHSVIDRDGDLVTFENEGVDPGQRWMEQKGARHMWQHNLYVHADTGAPQLDQYYLPSYARGVGKVFELSSEREELIDFCRSATD